jgi:hypothetical protein
MWKYVSLQRSRQGLLEATQQIHDLRASILAHNSTYENNVVEWQETVNMLKVAELVIAAAQQRRESRGSHSRLDYPASNEMLAGRHYVFHPVLEGVAKGAMLQEAEPQGEMPRGAMAQRAKPQGDISQEGRKGTSLLYYGENGELSEDMGEEWEEVTFNG